MILVTEIAWTHISTRIRQTTAAVLGVTCGVVLTILLIGLMEGMERNLVSSLVDAMAHVTVRDERPLAQHQPAEDYYGAAQVTNLPRTRKGGAAFGIRTR